jgi:iron-sulfur cluster repair protein YtfE (RIC family)
MAARHRRRLALASVTGAGVAAAGAARMRARRNARETDAPAEVSFMVAMHNALRRDLARLQEVAGRIDSGSAAPSTVLAGWDAFQTQLEYHHAAEDDNLWPVLRRELADPDDLAAVDAMTEEHRHIPPALDQVDRALRGDGDLPAAAEALSAGVTQHLQHEEAAVLPLIEKHMTRAQWRAFLVQERDRHAPRARTEFLTWLLDDADAHDSEAVFAEMPRPVRLVYRRFLKPRYDAQRRWQLPTP